MKPVKSPALWPLVVFLLAYSLNATLGNPVRALFPVYVDKVLGGSPLLTSGLFSLQNLIRLAVLVVGGVLADRVGAKLLLLLGLAAVSLTGLMFLTGDTVLLVAFSLGYGGLFTLRTMASRAYLNLVAPVAHLGLLGALYFSGPTVGGALGSMVAGPLVDRFGFAPLGLSVVVGNLGLVLLVALFLPPVAPEETKRTPVWTLARSYRELARRPLVWRLMGLRFFPTWWLGTTSVLVPLLLYRLTGTVTAAALYGSVSLLIFGFSQVIVGWLSDRFGKATPVVVSSLTLAVGPVLCALAASSAWLLAMASIFALLGAHWLAALMPSLVRSAGASQEQGRLTALTELAWTLGNLGGTMAAGALITYAVPLPFVLAGLLNLGTFLLALQSARLLRLQASPLEQSTGLFKG
jgi:MFS family permease